MGYECYKCGGTGEVSFRHIANGVCFACGGTGRLDRRASSKLVKLNYQPVAEDVRCTDKQWLFSGNWCSVMPKPAESLRKRARLARRKTR